MLYNFRVIAFLRHVSLRYLHAASMRAYHLEFARPCTTGSATPGLTPLDRRLGHVRLHGWLWSPPRPFYSRLLPQEQVRRPGRGSGAAVAAVWVWGWVCRPAMTRGAQRGGAAPSFDALTFVYFCRSGNRVGSVPTRLALFHHAGPQEEPQGGVQAAVQRCVVVGGE